MATQPNESLLTAGKIDNPNEGVDRSAAGIQFQHFQLGLIARGASLGIGRRTVPDPAGQFSMSNAQFGGGRGAKSLYGEPQSE
jgi:hypothetical protein